MTRGRRAVLLGGLALLLGTLAASDVSGREAALQARVGRPVGVVVVRRSLAAGDRLTAAALAVRQVPARFVPAGSYARVGDLTGLRAAVALPRGTDLVPALLDDGSAPLAAGAPVRRGERVAEITARGSADLISAGTRVDVLITRRAGDGQGRTELALEDAEVLAAAPATTDDATAGGGPRVALSLRATVRQAVALAAAADLGHELRVLPRAAGDRGHGLAGMASRG